MVRSGKGSHTRTKSKKLVSPASTGRLLLEPSSGKRKQGCGLKGEVLKSQIRGSERDPPGGEVLWDSPKAGNRNLAWLGVETGSDDGVWKIGLGPGTGEPASWERAAASVLTCSAAYLRALISWSSELSGLLGHAAAPIQHTCPGFHPSTELGHD